MQLVYIDFETHYRTGFDLTSAKSSGEYIGTTQMQMMGWAIGDGEVNLAVGEDQIRQVLNSIKWDQAAAVSHNALFDMRVLKQRFGVVPAFFFDTLSMMRATHWNQLFGGATLGHLSKVLQANGLSIEDKGSEVKEAKGKFLYKFEGGTWYMHEEEITSEYLKNLNLTKTGRPKTGKAYKDPREVVANAIQFYRDFADYCVKDVAICRAGFKEMVKLLPREEIYFQDMILRCAMFPQLQMDVPLLKSALTRAQTSLREAVNKIADKWFSGDYDEAKSALLSTGKLAILLKALGGMTQDEVDDYIATEGVHPEPPFIIPTKVSEKKTVKAGEPVYEYALAKKDPGMVELMQNPNEDLQEVLACRKTVVYFNNYEIPRLHRFINEQEYSGEVGMPLKVSGAFTHRLGGCLGNRTVIVVKTKRGEVKEKYIPDVEKTDLVWDGIEFVKHDGVIMSGYKKCVIYKEPNRVGLVGTPEHPVMVNGEWTPLAEVVDKGLVIDKGGDGDCMTFITRWKKYKPVYDDVYETFDILNCGPRTRFVANGYIVHNSEFNIQNLSSGRNDGQDATMRMSIMATDGRVVVGCDSSQIEARVLAFEANEQIILDEFKNGVDPYCALAEKIYNIPYAEINRRRKDESDPLHEEAKLQRQAGKAGRLGLGYQMGAVAFVDYAATLGVTLTMEESKRVVDVYRSTYSRTYSFWDQCAEVLKMLVAGQSGYFGGIDGKLFYFDGTRTTAGRRTPGIRLPDGMWLTYTDLQMRERTYPDGSKRWNFCYYGIKEGRPGWIWIYSGKVTENLTQALAFAIMKWQAMNINKRYPIAFNVHDEWVVTCDAADAENCRDYVVACMKQVPPWAVGCPIDAEGAYAKRYGEC